MRPQRTVYRSLACAIRRMRRGLLTEQTPPLIRVTTGKASSAASLAVPATSGGLTAQLLPAVQRGYNLAQRGAFYAARTEFIQVLRRVAQAKDATSGTDEHSRELAAGLRAMDEADDFVPAGAQLEG